ncbi:unnamed protein product [Acanthoscelides obtectus]|uniref:Uncharacterized protein n=1 Tax=Acanthoscelides obtectus TaxID=200917 RepID=A0A9P0P5E7_ACAOB|nr:unnamed protein product [Acanthoscelides obtectus]CAK1632346.1 hypothetical protein AOBTE_LOCUS7494 [Acanthoscelides obtectus]
MVLGSEERLQYWVSNSEAISMDQFVNELAYIRKAIRILQNLDQVFSKLFGIFTALSLLSDILSVINIMEFILRTGKHEEYFITVAMQLPASLAIILSCDKMLREAKKVLHINAEFKDCLYLNNRRNNEVLLLLDICKLYMPRASVARMFSISTAIIPNLISVTVTNLIVFASS